MSKSSNRGLKEIVGGLKEIGIMRIMPCGEGGGGQKLL